MELCRKEGLYLSLHFFPVYWVPLTIRPFPEQETCMRREAVIGGELLQEILYTYINTYNIYLAHWIFQFLFFNLN